MKLLTLNTHSWMEEEQLAKITGLARYINAEQFDVIALQEVNQSMNTELLPAAELERYYVAEEHTVIRQDNYACVLLGQLDQPYYWTWIPTHTGFSQYDEGLAILSRTPIEGAFAEYVSHMRDYSNYRTRKILGIQTTIGDKLITFVNGHFNWWDDEQEPFKGQWELTEDKLAPYMGQPLFIMGDFNNVAEVRGQGYDYILRYGWNDLYVSTLHKDDGATVVKAIGGWAGNSEPLRIDYIFANHQVEAVSVRVALNGTNGPVVSDHYGVAAEI
ncbi:endonuclease/exonuclease/phosphatase family protein [Paenibacillus sp. MMS20-IR301]|uniref:endonuclease/exonuclease/phosphatase family protein n=1 Tax=Paenibacillus sp. MMS20-IR301 TaxID=2895946 RepID=UPI0028F0F073|nr:endonuclease/exonuclease/phosphatase family protein [Paenibacillus sp. MMS20-IR301]WNS45260.1 endonuclease/exonuclease/phosphatase family protein [Paenibacillus sp. MMS20-IR301]